MNEAKIYYFTAQLSQHNIFREKKKKALLAKIKNKENHGRFRGSKSPHLEYKFIVIQKIIFYYYYFFLPFLPRICSHNSIISS